MSLSEIADRVAENTISRDMESEDWEKAVAINGLLALGGDRYTSAARELMDRSIETQTSEGHFSYSFDVPVDIPLYSITDPAALGYCSLAFYELTGEQKYLNAARRQYEFFETAERTADGGITHLTQDTELWVDTVYMLCPFFARYGHTTDTPEAVDDAVKQILIQAKHLQDPHTGLFRHKWRETPNSYPDGTFWSRGNGWVTAGIADTLEYLPDDHPERERVVQIFENLCDGVVQRQDRSGFWHNLIDDIETSLESSGTLMFAYSFMRGIELGLLSEEVYLEPAERAVEVCSGVVNDDGGVERVSIPEGANTPLEVTSYGQGWFLQASSCFL